jgi:hypothetical protein
MASLIGMNISETYTSEELRNQGKGFGLGDRTEDNAGNEFVFVQASAAIALGDVVSLTRANAAANLTTTASPRGQRVAVAVAAIAANSFGWVQIYGANDAISVGASCAANARLNTTTTGGRLDDDAGTGTKVIDGLVLTTARGGTDGTAPGMLYHPMVGATL